MAPLEGREARATNAPLLPSDFRFDPDAPLTLAIGLGTSPRATRPLHTPPLDEVPALILALLGRTEPSLSPLEQRVLRACLRLAGERLPLLGGLDADFYEALLAFKGRHDLQPVDPRLDLPTLTRIVQQAARVVGGPGQGRGRRLRSLWFDVMDAPGLVAEAPGITGLIRELKGGRTQAPWMAPVAPPRR